MTVTITVGADTREFDSPLAAIGFLLDQLPTEQLGGIYWADRVRRVKQERRERQPASPAGGPDDGS